jgi:Family of unknown function (DUF6188)
MTLAQGCSEFDARAELERNGVKVPLDHVAVPAHNGEGWIFRPEGSEYLNNAILAIAGNSYSKDEVSPVPEIHLENLVLTEIEGGGQYVSFQFGSSHSCRLLIEGTFEYFPSKLRHSFLRKRHNKVQAPDIGVIERLSPLIGQAVEKSEVNKKGSLLLVFGDQSTVRIEPDPRFQAWTFCGFGQVILSTPGGRVAIFG